LFLKGCDMTEEFDGLPIIVLGTDLCIQCDDVVDLATDNFTFYQAEKGNHYLYCERCKSPYEPLPNPYEQIDIERDRSLLAKLKNPLRSVGMFGFGIGIGIAIGWII
jgi:hypothetical protein